MRRPRLGRFVPPSPGDNLLPWVIAAAAAAMLVPGVARALRPTVLPALAVMVFGVGVTVTPTDLRAAGRRPLVVVVALAVGWTAVPAAGIALAKLSNDPTVAHGIEITAFAPAEITSVLMVMLAGGSVALGAAVMASSLLTGAVLTPLWVRWALGSSAHVSTGGLIVELALGVALPFVAALAVSGSTRVPRRLLTRGADLSAAAVVYVVFAGTGDARHVVASGRIVVAMLLCLALVVAGAAAGRAAGILARATGADAAAVLYPVAMREFGLATSVATLVAPPSAAIAALYGIILMIVTPVVAGRTRSSSRRPRRNPGASRTGPLVGDVEVVEFVGVEDEVDGGDAVVDDGEAGDRDDPGSGSHDDAGGAVDQGWLAVAGEARALGGDLAGDVGGAGQEGGYGSGAGAGVDAEDDAGVEDGQQGVEVAGAGGGEERGDDGALGGQVGVGDGGGTADSPSGAAGELPGGGGCAVDDRGDLFER